jgi:hypothetical protein
MLQSKYTKGVKFIPPTTQRNNLIMKSPTKTKTLSITNRIAIVGLAWSLISRLDIFVLLQSFLPKNGELLSVNIFPSEYGLIKAKEELLKGPKYSFKSNSAENIDASSETNLSENMNVRLDKQYLLHEKSKSLWYFAIAEFDSVSTSDFVYSACDGLDYGPNSTALDLRFVPETIDLSRLKPKDTATVTPHIYTKPHIRSRTTHIWEHSDYIPEMIPKSIGKEIDSICIDSKLATENEYYLIKKKQNKQKGERTRPRLVLHT